LAVSPVFDGGVEVLPGGLEAGRTLEGEIRHEGGEAFVEPEVVPPAHGDQIPEPHVRQLVEDGLGAAPALAFGGRVTEDHVLVVGNGADVLHRTGIELRHEDLVVLVEGERVAEEVGVEFEPLFRDFENLVVVEVSEQRLADVEPQLQVAVAVSHHPVRPGDEREEVGAEGWGLGELPLGAAVRPWFPPHCSGVGNYLPFAGSAHGEAVAGLNVRLVEAGKEPVRFEGFEVGVEVLPPIFGVDELVEAVTRVVVLVLVLDLDGVLRAEGLLREVDAIPAAVRLHLDAVHGQPEDVPAPEIEEHRALDGRVEVDGGFAPVP